MDAKEISEKAAKAKAARSSWTTDMLSRVVAAGQSIISSREQIKMASAPERQTPFATRHNESVGRNDVGSAESGARDLHRISAMDKDRQINNAVARARQLVEKKLASMPISSPDINYLKAEISRWDDHSGQPQTGRISFQIPFSGPQGDPRTIYASVDLVLGDLMEPKTFNDGLNNAYAFDMSGLKQLFQGQDFDVVHQPKVTPEPKYTGPEFHAPDGIPGSVAAVDSPLMFRKSSSELVKKASVEKATIARAGLVRPISKEANQIAQPIAPGEGAGLDKTVVRKPANAGTSFNVGTSAEDNRTNPHENHTQGGQVDPTLASKASAELREINWDGTIRTTAKGEIKELIEIAHAVTYGGHDYVVEVWDKGNLVERIASSGKRPGSNLRLATAMRVMQAKKSDHENKPEAPKFDLTGSIMAFEDGSLDEEGVLELFQHLVDTGLAWSLQGSYGRAAASLLERGLIQPANSDKKDYYGNTVKGKPRDDAGLEPEASARGLVRTASLSKAIKDLRLLDVRMVNFRDLVMLCKQHGQESNLSFDSASKELAKAGIVLYRTASAADNNLLRRVVHAKRMLLAAPPDGTMTEMPGTSPTNAPADGAPADINEPAPGGATGTPQIAPPAGLDPVEFKEFQALLDQYNNEWETVHQRELNNIKNGNQPSMGVEYTDLQTLYDKIDAFQQQSKSRKSEEIAANPADLASAPKTAPTTAPEASANGTGESTLIPQKGNGLAAQSPKMQRVAFEGTLCAAQAKKEKCAKCGGEVGETIVAKGGKVYCSEDCAFGKTATYDLDDDAKVQMVNMGKDPGNPEDVKQFMGTFKKVSSQSLDMPEVCKNCKHLVVPNGYSNLREFKHTRKPFCGAEKTESVGFNYAIFRDCAGYDPIVKDIKQKIESKAPESEQKPGEGEKHYKTAAALPSADPKAVREKDSQTGGGLDVREWCEKAGHYAPAGDVHPTHDWCTLWNTAVENLVMLPSGAVVPRSMSGQSAETHGEGGPHQFGNTPNQTI